MRRAVLTLICGDSGRRVMARQLRRLAGWAL